MSAGLVTIFSTCLDWFQASPGARAGQTAVAGRPAPAAIGNLIDLDTPASTQISPALQTTQQNMANVSK